MRPPLTFAVRPLRRVLLRVASWLVLVLALVAGAALIVIKTDWFAGRLREVVTELLSKRLSADVHIGRLAFELLPARVVVEDVSVAPRGHGRLVSVQRAEAHLRPMALLQKRVDIPRLVVDGAEVTAEVLDGRLLNLPALPPKDKKPSAWALSLGRVELHRTDVSATVRGSAGPAGEPLRRVLGALSRLRGRVAPTGAATLVARVGGLEVEVSQATGVWDASVRALGGALDAAGLHETLGRLRARARLDREGTLRLRHLEVALGGTEVALLARGTARDLPALVAGRGGRVDGKVVLAVEAAAASAMLPRIPALQGMVKLDVDVSGSTVRDLAAKGQLAWQDARVAAHRLGDVRLALEVDARGARIDDVRAEFAGARMKASARVGFTHELPVEAKVSMKELALGKLLAALGETPIPVELVPTGTVEVRGRLRAPGKARVWPELRMRTALTVRDILVRQGAPGAPKVLFVPDARVEGEVVLRGEEVTLDGVLARIGRSDLNVRGRIHAGRETISIDVVSDNLRLESLGTIAGLPWGGHGTLRASVRGTFKNVHAVGSFDLEGLSFLGHDVDRASGQVEFANGVLGMPLVAVSRDATRLTASATLRPATMGLEADIDVVRGNTRDILRLLKLPLVYGHRYAADLSGEVHVRGTVRDPVGWGDLTLRDVSIYSESLHEVRARGAFTKSGWVIERLVARKTKDAGRVEVAGTISRTRELDLSVRTDGLSLALIELPQLKAANLSSDVALTATLRGTMSRPEGKGAIALRNLVVRGQPQRDSELEFVLRGDQLDVTGQLLGARPEGAAAAAPRGRVALSGRLQLSKAFPFQAQLDFAELDLARFVDGDAAKALQPLAGGAAFEGALSRPDAIEGKLVVSRLVAEFIGSYRVANTEPIRLSSRGTSLRVDSFKVAGREATLALGGTVQGDGRLGLTVEGSGNLRLLSTFVKALQQPAGTLQFRSTVNGTFARPALIGSGMLTGVRFGLQNFPHRLDDVTAELRFSQEKVIIRELKGKFADGTVSGDGELILARPLELRLHLNVDDAALRYPEDFPSRASARFDLFGPLDLLTLKGQVKVQRARYTKDFKLEELLLKRSRGISKVLEKRRDRLLFDIDVVAADDVRVVNNIADLEFRSSLHVGGTNRAVTVVGTAQNARTGTIRFQKNVFKVDRAIVVWKEGDPLDDPYLDIETTTRVRNFDILVSGKGRRTELLQTDGRSAVDISCGSGLSPADCISLLQAGLTIKELNAVQPGRAGVATAADVFSGLLGDKLSEGLPVFDTFRIGSGYSEYSQSIVPLVTIGKELPRIGSVNWRVVGTTSLIEPSKDFRAQVEFDLARSLSVTGEYVNLPRTGAQGASVGTSLGNVGIDLRYRFEF